MLKLRFGRFVESNWNHPMNKASFNNAVREFGIEIVTEGEHILFEDTNCLKGDRPPDRPTIAWERLDTSRITPGSMFLDNDPNIIGFCVPFLALQPELSIAKEVYNNGQEYPLPSKNIGVITTMLWNRMERDWASRLEIPKTKRIRASFCGTVFYPGVPFTTHHRLRLKNEWPVDKTFAIWNGVRHYFHVERDLFKFIQESKVVVSPWGVCEISIRDYETVTGLAMMVKPRQSKMQVNCNPWHEENTVYCEPDFSDLEEAIAKAESLWNKDKMWSLAHVMVEEGTSIEKFAKHFATAIHHVCST